MAATTTATASPSSPSSLLPPLPLPQGTSSSYLRLPSGLTMHYLSCGSSTAPLIILLHGFPELAFSFRHMLTPLARAGYYVVAPDQRGYGRTTSPTAPAHHRYEDADLREFSMLSLARDVVGLVHGLGYARVECLVGHDFGAVVAEVLAAARADMVARVCCMSHPFAGMPRAVLASPDVQCGADGEPPAQTDEGGKVKQTEEKKKGPDIHAALAALAPPRKLYKFYYASAAAAADLDAPAGMPDFLLQYFYLKSGSWAGNAPHALAAASAAEFARMPYYYCMPLGAGMREACRMALAESGAAARYPAGLTQEELGVYVAEFTRTGFQGGLNWYRVVTHASLHREEMALFAGMKIAAKGLMVLGRRDWGTFQDVGAVERMEESFVGGRVRTVWVEGAGHFMQMERPGEVVDSILGFCKEP
jgi:pimeloyl-ACP methyl ester carboxylesterase